MKKKLYQLNSVEETKTMITQLIKDGFKEIEEAQVQKEEFLTPKETAKFLKVSENTIRNWSNQGILSKYFIGGKTLYDKNQIINNIKTKRICF